MPTTRTPPAPGQGRCVLMSIRPRFAEQILAGGKRVELRRRRLGDEVTCVVVYATSPVRAIVGAFGVAGQDTRPPADLWAAYCDVAGIGHEDYVGYFDGCAQATAIRVGAVWVPAGPVPLAATGLTRPPQSWQYLPGDVAAQLLAAMAPPGAAG